MSNWLGGWILILRGSRLRVLLALCRCRSQTLIGHFHDHELGVQQLIARYPLIGPVCNRSLDGRRSKNAIGSSPVIQNREGDVHLVVRVL